MPGVCGASFNFYLVISSLIITLNFKALFMQNNPEQDIEHIRHMMERSSRFLSLSGLSGVFAGIFALVAAFIAYSVFKSHGINYFSHERFTYTPEMLAQLVVLSLLTLTAAIGSAIFFTVRKSRKTNVVLWNSLSRRLLLNFSVPLIAGGIFCIGLYANFQYALIAPVMLIFYGLALINAAKYTYTDINYLGYIELILGLIALFFIGYGLLFWAIGFGIFHIIYGIMMYNKYE